MSKVPLMPKVRIVPIRAKISKVPKTSKMPKMPKMPKVPSVNTAISTKNV